MTIKELIEELKAFDENEIVELEIDTECGCLLVGSFIDDVQFKGGNCVLAGKDY